MRTDQRHDQQGQFSTRNGYEGPDRLEYPIGCKVDAHELRKYTIMFDQNRRQFGWQTMSDMYRAMLAIGYEAKVKEVKNPTADMKRMLRNSEERERIRSEAVKHRELALSLENTDHDLRDTFDAGDLAGVRRILAEFQSKTKEEDDPAVRNRREVEFDRRWGRIWESLNRAARLPIDD